MKVHVFDVEHGECIIVETPNGKTILIGAGHNSTTGWRPSLWFSHRRIPPTCFVMSNLDRDHLSDLPNFEPSLRPYVIKKNHYVDPDWVSNKKIEESGEIHPGVRTALHWIKNVFTGTGVSIDYEIEKRYFTHSPSNFQDTNNLSVVTFIAFNDIGFLFPSDVEKAGLEEFLLDADFIYCLKRTNILLAPHHGRKVDYTPELFNYCNPDLVVISDKPVTHDTQDHSLYSQHAKGVAFNDGTVRKVLSTRKDGKITFEVTGPNAYTFEINSTY